MLRNFFYSAFCLALLPAGLSAQNNLVFPNGAKVCFVGNSITQAGEYVHYIRGFYATRYPDQKVEFINCGISGDVTGGILARLQPDIMVHQPDYAVIMIGMNDVNRPLYAAKYNWSIMTDINKKMQATDSSFTIVGKDRVHPASPGHFTMAYQFLHSTIGALPANTISLHYGSKKVVTTRGENLTDLEFSKDKIQFTCQPGSLPFAMFPAAVPALNLVPFTKEFNTELLKVAGLPKGNYRLTISDSIAGEFSAAQFGEGINLSLLNTPQTRQAKEVLDYCLKMKALESDLRQLRHMEYRTLFKLPNGNIKDSGIAILQRKLADTATKKNERGPAERYLKNKPKEEELYKEWSRMQQKLYEINKPGVVRVKIEKI